MSGSGIRVHHLTIFGVRCGVGTRAVPRLMSGAAEVNVEAGSVGNAAGTGTVDSVGTVTVDSVGTGTVDSVGTVTVTAAGTVDTAVTVTVTVDSVGTVAVTGTAAVTVPHRAGTGRGQGPLSSCARSSFLENPKFLQVKEGESLLMSCYCLSCYC
jgi:hypothetical protein